MKQNDWIILAGVILLLWYLSRPKPVVSSTFTFPNAQYDENGNYTGDSTRESGGDLLSHIIEQQGDTAQYF